MSELSAEEKRRLLRERRQAKMGQGKATERLNNILSQGSSVNSTAVKSVLDNPAAGAPKSATLEFPVDSSANSSAHKLESPHPSLSHDDPEVPDISLLLQKGTNGAGAEEPNMDEIMQKIFAGAGVGADGEGKNAGETPQFFAEMMKTMALDPNAIPETPENASYQTKLAAYNEYQQKSWKARFLVIRFLVHTANFLYHYLNFAGFGASSHAFVRQLSPVGAGTFTTFFVSAEIVIVSSYFLILSSNGVLGQSSRNHPLSKLLSLASTFVPKVSAYQSVLDSALVYWGGANIIIGDIMLMVVFFGLVSILS